MRLFRAVTEKSGRFMVVSLPFDAEMEFGEKGRIAVRGTVAGQPFREKLIPKGRGKYLLPLSKAKFSFPEGSILEICIGRDTIAEKSKNAIESEETDMDVLSAIGTRRSIRRYTGEPVSEKSVETILNAGFCAPSAKNKRPWHFVVIRDKAALDAISEQNPNHKLIAGADCCIVVCGDRMEQGLDCFLYEDCAAALQNMLLAAHGLGLGAVWCGLYKGGRGEPPLRERLGLPEKVEAIGIVALGHPAEERLPPPRFEASKVHFEKW